MDDYLLENYIGFAQAILLQHIVDYKKSFIWLYRKKDSADIYTIKYRKALLKHIMRIQCATEFFDSSLCFEIVSVTLGKHITCNDVKRETDGRINKILKDTDAIIKVNSFIDNYLAVAPKNKKLSNLNLFDYYNMND